MASLYELKPAILTTIGVYAVLFTPVAGKIAGLFLLALTAGIIRLRIKYRSFKRTF